MHVQAEFLALVPLDGTFLAHSGRCHAERSKKHKSNNAHSNEIADIDRDHCQYFLKVRESGYMGRSVVCGAKQRQVKTSERRTVHPYSLHRLQMGLERML